MDGTLVDNTPVHIRAFEIFCERYGIRDWKEKLGQAYGMGNDDIMKLIMPAEVIREKGLAALAEEKESIYREIYAPEIVPMPGKILARRAQRICVAYEGMDRFFAPGKITMTGNPLRGRFSKEGADRGEALAYYGFRAELPVVLVVGGSLGTRSLNEMMKAWILSLGGADAPVQVIWQTGKYYEREMQAFLAAHPTGNIWQGAFIDRMDYAYAAADLVVSRSGAGTVSELCLVARPVLFVPSPNVAEDHQTKNALALVNKQAAIYVKDSEAETTLMDVALSTVNDEQKLKELTENIAKLALPDSARIIAQEVIKLAEAKNR